MTNEVSEKNKVQNIVYNMREQVKLWIMYTHI